LGKLNNLGARRGFSTPFLWIVVGWHLLGFRQRRNVIGMLGSSSCQNALQFILSYTQPYHQTIRNASPNPAPYCISTLSLVNQYSHDPHFVIMPSLYCFPSCIDVQRVVRHGFHSFSLSSPLLSTKSHTCIHSEEVETTSAITRLTQLGTSSKEDKKNCKLRSIQYLKLQQHIK